MSEYRFQVGSIVMCNLGAKGWQLGRIIALRYREPHWSPEQVAPYQVALESDHGLVYVPEDDVRLCREATPEDIRIARRMDALAALPADWESLPESPVASQSRRRHRDAMSCSGGKTTPDNAHRAGGCHCCNPCPRDWSFVELYSEHYRCAARNQLNVTHHVIDLGSVTVGTSIYHRLTEGISVKNGYGQAPTLVRLPPGIAFSDDGILSGEVAFDPHRGETYAVDFVAVSTAQWGEETVGLVRLEVSFTIQENLPPNDFDLAAFKSEQQNASSKAARIVERLYQSWTQWERRTLSNRDTCDQMLADLARLRALLEVHPRLDGGRWWVQLGGLHMNVHKLLENALFECELYLGFALTFGDPEVRRLAEQNLDGCYQKRLLEAARFMWMDGAKLMMQGEWQDAVNTFQRAAAKKEGWGWAVNYGDIWLGEACALMVLNAAHHLHQGGRSVVESASLKRVQDLVDKADLRAREARVFGSEGHPWILEICEALKAYHDLLKRGENLTHWLEGFKIRIVYWCAQILGGSEPFPPKPKARIADADTLLRRLEKAIRNPR